MLFTTGGKLELASGSIVKSMLVAAGSARSWAILFISSEIASRSPSTQARLRPHRKPQCSICAELNVVQARDGFRHGRTRHEKRTQEAADEERVAGREFRPAAAEVREGVHVVDAHNRSRVVGCWPSYVFLSSVWHEATNRIPGIHHEHELMTLQDLGRVRGPLMATLRRPTLQSS